MHFWFQIANQYRRIKQSQIDVNELTLNEFRSLVSSQVEDKFIETTSLNELFKLLPDFFDHKKHWCDDFSVSEIKSLLWMDDYELYPLKLEQIKAILSEYRTNSINH